MTGPECTCYPVPEKYWTTHYGAVDPATTMEPNPECPAHFPAPAMTAGFDCGGCDYTQAEPSLSAAMDHALATGHELVHVIDDEGTTATVSVTEADPDEEES